jgi:acetyltransferase-like isoleucine patch superfamily enzyme
VVVAVRNAEKYLANTLLSLRDQTCQDFEVILIDGASVDHTMRVASDFRDIIKFQVSEIDSGIAEAWNKGVRHARGQWITFLNAGDLVHRDHFLRVFPFLQVDKNKPVIFYCDVLKFNTNNEPTFKIFGCSPSANKIYFGGIGFPHPGSFCSIECFNQIGLFNTNLCIAIDTDWLMRAFKHEHVFKKFNSVAYMLEGGISDLKFSSAMKEFFSSAIKLQFISSRHAKLLTLVLPAARKFIHLYRSVFRAPLRTIKHAFISLANILEILLPFHWLRHAYFKLLGFRVGKRASIGKGFQFYKLGGITIGHGTVVNRSCLFDNRDCIDIGENVSIARNVSIFTAGHDPESPLFEMTTAPVFIEHHVVIFAGATVMPGVRIGAGAVVYGGAVVTKDVEPMTIVGGVPARLISKRNTKTEYKLNYPYPLAM